MSQLLYTTTTSPTSLITTATSSEIIVLCSFPFSTINESSSTSDSSTSDFIASGIPERIPEDPRTEILRRYSYGIILPTICFFGIVGNILNLVVLTRRNMRGTAYIYMRGMYN